MFPFLAANPMKALAGGAFVVLIVMNVIFFNMYRSTEKRLATTEASLDKVVQINQENTKIIEQMKKAAQDSARTEEQIDGIKTDLKTKIDTLKKEGMKNDADKVEFGNGF